MIDSLIADEISCEDTSDPNDWNADGLVNYEEFDLFAENYLLHDPNDSSIITDPNFIGDPNYVDPETLEYWRQYWDPFYNLDGSGTSEYNIDLADLTEFIDNSYWLWQACWRDGFISAMSVMAGGGESMMMMMMMPMSMESFAPAIIEQEAPTLEELAEQLLKTLDWLDEIWLDPGVQESIDEEDWLDFIESVEESLIDIVEQQEE